MGSVKMSKCYVVDFDSTLEKFEVDLLDPIQNKAQDEVTNKNRLKVARLFLCFDAEDPVNFVKRIT